MEGTANSSAGTLTAENAASAANIAALLCDIKNIMQYLQKNVMLNHDADIHVSLLRYAIEQNHPRLVEVLVRNGAKVTDETINLAHDRGTPGIVRALHTARNSNSDESFVYHATTTDNPELLQIAIGESSGQEDELLLNAIEENSIEMIYALLQKGVSNLAHIKIPGYGNLLHWAAAKGHLDIVKFIIDNNLINPDLENDKGETPAELAAQNGHAAITVTLMDAGANALGASQRDILDMLLSETPTTKEEDVSVFTALEEALDLIAKNLGSTEEDQEGHDNPEHQQDEQDGHDNAADNTNLPQRTIFDQLLELATEKKDKAKVADVLLAIAVRDEDTRLAAMAIEAGASHNNAAESLLRLAIKEKNVELIETLAKTGTNMNVKIDGKTPLQLSVELEDPRLIASLAKAGADMKAEVGKQTTTVIHLAAKKANPKLIEALLDHATEKDLYQSLKSKDQDGNTPLEIAAQSQSSRVTELLAATLLAENLIQLNNLNPSVARTAQQDKENTLPMGQRTTKKRKMETDATPLSMGKGIGQHRTIETGRREIKHGGRGLA